MGVTIKENNMTGLTRGSTMARSMWSCPTRWILATVAAVSLVTGITGEAATSIPPGAIVEVDQPTVNQILDVFHKAEAAIAAGNLDGVMALYAPSTTIMG
jgi:hypothetical protein